MHIKYLFFIFYALLVSEASSYQCLGTRPLYYIATLVQRESAKDAGLSMSMNFGGPVAIRWYLPHSRIPEDARIRATRRMIPFL